MTLRKCVSFRLYFLTTTRLEIIMRRDLWKISRVNRTIAHGAFSIFGKFAICPTFSWHMIMEDSIRPGDTLGGESYLLSNRGPNVPICTESLSSDSDDLWKSTDTLIACRCNLSDGVFISVQTQVVALCARKRVEIISSVNKTCGGCLITIRHNEADSRLIPEVSIC